MPWLMDELAIYCFHCLLGNMSKWLRALLQWQRRWLVQWLEQHSAVNNNMVGVVYNSITAIRWQRKRQRPMATGDISMESHSQYLASPPLLFMSEVSLHAFKVLFALIFSLLLPLSQGNQSMRRWREGWQLTDLDKTDSIQQQMLQIKAAKSQYTKVRKW